MAKVTRQHLGELQGKVNNDIFRRTPKGGTSVYRINNWTEPDTLEYKENNDRFSIGNTFACAVNDLVNISKIWEAYRNLKGVNARNKIFNLNYRYCNYNYITSDANIVPDGLDCPVNGVNIDDNSIELELLPSTGMVEEYNDSPAANCLIYLGIPDSNRKGSLVLKDYSFITVQQHLNELNLKAGESFKVRFFEDEGKYKHIKYYNLVRVYFSIVFKNSKNKIKWTYSLPFVFKGAEIDEEYDSTSYAKVLKSRELAKIPPKVFYKLKQR